MELKTIVIMLLTFHFSSLPNNIAGNKQTAHLLHRDECEEKSCHPAGPAIRFPFRILDKQPEYCSYNSSYNLHCDEQNRTILSTKFVVTNISYESQRMEVEPFESCFEMQLRGLDLSTTPFEYYMDPDEITNFYNHTYLERVSLFNCSMEGNVSHNYAHAVLGKKYCLNTEGYFVHLISADASLKILARTLQSCRKMYNTNLIPVFIYRASSLNLSWSSPNCGRCEVQGGICQWKNRNSKKIGCLVGREGHSGPIIGCFLLLPAIAAVFFLKSKMEEQKKNQLKIRKFLEDYAAMKPTRYSYADIKKITKNFRDKLGEGNYGNVFKGKIANKIHVAVKLMHHSAGNGEEFVNEVGTIGTIHHVNVVRLLGFCADGYKRALVYEFQPNGSLYMFICPDGEASHTLGIARLQTIAIGIARGIEYLHQGCQQTILHFDIKPHNILLDESYNPKISDFGLAKLCEKGKSAVSMTAARGTMGYIAPEVFSKQFGNVTYKSDIYSFGMLLLEMVGRRKNIDATVQNNSQVYLPEWIYERLVDGEDLRIQIEEDGEDEIAKRLAIVGLCCIQWNPVDRPSMSSVLQMLEGNCDNLDLPSNPFTSNNVVKSVDTGEQLQERDITPVLAVISE